MARGSPASFSLLLALINPVGTLAFLADVPILAFGGFQETDAMVPPIARILAFEIRFGFCFPFRIVLVFPHTNWVEPVEPEGIKLGTVSEEKVTTLFNSHPDSSVECDNRGMVVWGCCGTKRQDL